MRKHARTRGRRACQGCHCQTVRFIPPPLFQPVSHSPIVSHPIILPPLFHPLPCSHCLPSDHSTPSLPPLAPIVSDPIIPPPLLHPLLPLTRGRERGDTRREGGGKRKPGAARGQHGTGTLPFAARITPMYSTMRAFFNVRIPQLPYDK
jgi:hypothetical protein